MSNGWKIIEIILRKPLEEIIDVVTGEWKCAPCKAKQKYISKDAVLEALKEKNKNK